MQVFIYQILGQQRISKHRNNGIHQKVITNLTAVISMKKIHISDRAILKIKTQTPNQENNFKRCGTQRIFNRKFVSKILTSQGQMGEEHGPSYKRNTVNVL